MKPRNASSSRGQPLSPGLAEYTTTCLVNNVHCASCVDYVRDVLRSVDGVINVETSILNHEVRVHHHGPSNVANKISSALIDAAFEVHHVSTFNRDSGRIAHFSPKDRQRWWEERTPLASLWSSTGHTTWFRAASKQQRKHVKNCNSCQTDHQSAKRSAKSWKGSQRKRRVSPLLPLTSTVNGEKSPKESDIPQRSPRTPPLDDDSKSRSAQVPSYDGLPNDTSSDLKEWEVTLSIGGMTCASCTSNITTVLQQLDFMKSVNVTLMTNSAEVVFTGKKDNYKLVIDAVEDIGYEASLEKVAEKSSGLEKTSGMTNKFLATLSIEGMTCTACINTITRGLKELSFVGDVTIELVANSGRVEFEGKEHVDAILEKIDDLGYEATLVSLDSLGVEPNSQQKPTERTIMIKVDGMFCDHCPGNVLEALRGADLPLKIDEVLSLQDPVLTIVYTPSPPAFTIRNIVATIDDAHQAFKSSIFHPPTLEERSRTMQIHEQHRLLLRLLVTFIIAIPTFIIGIVYMSLVPKSNKSRRWLEEPIWAGSATREDWALFIVTTPVMVFGADVFHVRAAKEMKALWHPGSKVPILRRFYRFGSMNLLISAGTGVAYFSSLAVLILAATQKSGSSSGHSSDTYFDSVVFLTFFILIGRYLEAYSRAKTGDAVAMLGKLRPSEAILITNSDVPAESGNPDEEKYSSRSTQRVDVDFLEAGDLVIVPHGASPPTDGTIEDDGTFQFNESSLTGESKPVKKLLGEKVFAGSVNVGQPVHVRVTEIGGMSMLDGIVSVVRQGQAKRAPVERIADILTGYFVPVITLIAVITFVVWFALGQSGALPHGYLDVQRGGWAFWSIEFAIAVFVVACPCGIGLAAPTALFVGGGLAAKHGILVRGGGEAFQEASRLDAVVFDKTGTLTEGESLEVSDDELLTSDATEAKIVWALAQAMEEASTHPIAQAVAKFAATKDRCHITKSEITEIRGQGMRGTFVITTDDRERNFEAAIGNHRLLDSLISDTAHAAENYHLTKPILDKYQSQGKSTAILSMRCRSDLSSEQPFAPKLVVATEDPIRSEAPAIIMSLQERGLDVHMCTGDNPTTARAVASRLGISPLNVAAGVLPGGKAEYINLLQKPENGGKRTIVAFVGDGTNDTPALCAADVSIAMASGSDVAVSTASFILLNSNLRTLLELVTLSKRVFRRVEWNFGWAGVYNVLLIPVAAGVFYPIGSHWRLSPVWASAAMAASSVSVVMSSLVLRWEGNWSSMLRWCVLRRK